MTKLSNSPSRAMVFDTVEQVAYALARGKDGMADSALMLYRMIRDDETADTDGLARDFYRAVRSRAEVIAIDAGKPLKDQTVKSFDAQVSKLACFPTLGEVARDNPHVNPAMDYAVSLVSGGYTKLVKCAVAVKSELAKDIHAHFDTLKTAIDVALVEKVKLASEEVTKIANAWDKLVKGTDEEPSEFRDTFDRLRQAYPADYARSIADNLAAIALILERAEQDAELKVALTKAK